MSLAVADEDDVVAIDKNSVRPGHPASQRVAILTPVVRVAASLSRAGNQFNRHFTNINHSDRMAFGVGQINIAVWRDTQTFRAGQRGQFSRAAVAGAAFLSYSRHVMNLSGLHIQTINGVAFA